MRRVLHVAVAGFLMTFLLGCNAKPSKLAEDDLRDVDLGQLNEGEKPAHVFAIRNTTGKPFQLLSVEKSCGCQTATVSEGTVVAADEVLKVIYELPQYVTGKQSGHLILHTNAADERFQRIELTLSAEIPAKLWASPSSLDFTVPSDEPESVKVLRVESAVPGLLERFRKVTTSRGSVGVELLERSSDSLVIRVTANLEIVGGDSYDFVRVEFDDPNFEYLNVRVHIRKHENVTLIPRSLEVPIVPGSQSENYRVRVMAFDRTFQISGVDCPDNIKVHGIPAEAKETVDLTLEVAPPADSRTADVVVLHTGSPGNAILSVSYVPTLRSQASVLVPKVSATNNN